MSLAVLPKADVPTPPNEWGSCFDAVAHNFIAPGNAQEKSAVVCHGIGIANRPGQEGTKIAHAWIEFDNKGQRIAMDCIWLKFVPADWYRKNLQVEYVVEYDRKEFMRLWSLHDFPGPWDKKIKPFTRDAS